LQRVCWHTAAAAAAACFLQGLSNTAWAFAKLGFSSPVLFEALAEAALGKLDAFTAQGLSNTAWAYATMGHYHPALVQQLAEQVSAAGCG
jgi:hypothetical protein